MQEGITQWREEGEQTDHPDLPHVLLGVDGVITDLSALRSVEDPDAEAIAMSFEPLSPM